ncbi:MAG: efflux RND transporter periplasmic adaptor subunit [Lachnospiraceae bacterium]|nr:efflux RND transporter periplasmic adaptor subunit [Lachnospiraceae bacterium]
MPSQQHTEMSQREAALNQVFGSSSVPNDEPDEDLVPVDLGQNAQENPAQQGAAHSGSEHAEHGSPVRAKKGMDPYKKKRLRKTIITIAVILALIGAGLFVYFKFIKPAKSAAEAMMNQMNETTDTIERRDITNSITTTGIIEAADVRTLTSTAKDTTIDAVMADVGDTVTKGETVVMFSTENINKTISQLQEDLSVQKQKDAIDSKASERSYLYTYSVEATDLVNAANDVDSALKALYEACDGYGDAKRELQDAKDSGKEGAELEIYENAVASAYQTEQAAKDKYDAAVRTQANMIASTNNTLTEADENHQKTAITAGDQARTIARQIEEYQDKLDDYVITAPISGIVTSVSVEEGNGFSGGNVMVIQNTDSFKISAKIDEYDISDIKLGQRVVIKTDATRDDELDGYVSFIAPTSTTTATGNTTSNAQAASSSSNVDYEVTITVRSKDDRLKIGMSAKLNIIVDQVSDVLTVPYDAIQTNAQGNYYITVVDEDAKLFDFDATKKEDTSKGEPVLQIKGEEPKQSGTSGPITSSGKPNGGPGGFGAPGGDAQMPQRNTKDIVVEVGMEGDYYTQIISPDIKPGMTVIIPDDGKFDMSDMGMMFGF